MLAIVFFDLRDKVFGEMAFPNCFIWDDCIKMNAIMLDGFLALVPTKWSLLEGDYYSV